MVRANGAKSAKVIQVIETKSERGLGIERDPVREVTQYWALDGKLLAERDEDSQFLSELSMWESERLKEIIEDLKENYIRNLLKEQSGESDGSGIGEQRDEKV